MIGNSHEDPAGRSRAGQPPPSRRHEYAKPRPSRGGIAEPGSLSGDGTCPVRSELVSLQLTYEATDRGSYRLAANLLRTYCAGQCASKTCTTFLGKSEILTREGCIVLLSCFQEEGRTSAGRPGMSFSISTSMPCSLPCPSGRPDRPEMTTLQ